MTDPGPQTPQAERLVAILDQAEDGLLWLARQRAAACVTPLECEKVLRDEISPLLDALGPVARDQYVKDLAKVFSVGVRALRELLESGTADAQYIDSPATFTKGDSGNGGPPREDSDEVTEAVAAFNEDHLVVDDQGSVYVARRKEDPLSGREYFDFMTYGDFTRYYSNVQVWVPSQRRNGGMRREQVAKLWLESNRPTYQGLVFDPSGREHKGWLNLWRGFAVEPQRGDCSLYWEHVRQVIALGNPDLYSYLRRWMAHAVQKTAELPEVAIVLRGLQGTGKGVFARPFGRLFGQHFLAVSNMEHVSGRFSGHLKDVIVLYADEALWGGRREAEGNFKALVTENRLGVESKHKDLVSANNYKRVIVATNTDWPIARDRDDRRTVVIDVPAFRKEDRDYFRAIHEQMESGGLAALLWDLQNEPLDGFDPRERPSVDAGFDIKLRTASDVHQWWHQCLVDEVNDSHGEDHPAGDVRYWNEEPRVDDLYKHYLKWADRLRVQYLRTREHWARTLREIVPHLRVIRPRTEDRQRCYRVGGVNQCRASFAEAYRTGMEIWEDNPGQDEEIEL